MAGLLQDCATGDYIIAATSVLAEICLSTCCIVLVIDGESLPFCD